MALLCFAIYTRSLQLVRALLLFPYKRNIILWMGKRVRGVENRPKSGGVSRSKFDNDGRRKGGRAALDINLKDDVTSKFRA